MNINILNVSEGVFWVEVAKINLRILCASPADIVKQLLQKGFIKNTQKDNTTYQTGPNAILLSDIMIQNSSFSNLTEFPILQMLYKQGMIIPNHPNNDGSKPLLIGSKKQIDIQMNYIYNGNYGLEDEDDIIKSGANKDLANNIMRMKLKFAFGQMKNSKDLINSACIEDNKKNEIKDGLTITRCSQNVFEFEFEGEKATIDLNLKENQNYLPTYKLGYKQTYREYFSVIHTGEGDGWDINRPCMGSILIFQGKIYLIDTGPHILETLNALGIGTNEIEGIFQTHAHDDHFAGITSLLLNDHKIKYFCSSIVRHSVTKKLSILLNMKEEDIAIFFDFIDLKLDQWNYIKGLEVKPSLSPHPIETNIYYFRTVADNGYKIYAHLADISSFEVLKGMITNDNNDIGISKEYFDEVKSLYLEYADVKKIDIGGGMIHGQAKDFLNDPSSKLLLSHTSLELSKEDKVIGSGAAFGTEDVLIPSRQDYNYKYAYKYLTHHFKDAPKSSLEMLLNSETTTLNPNSIILREKEKIEYIYLIITGNIECISTIENTYNILSSGSIIGEIQGLLKESSPYTFRTLSYVKALKIPLSKYINFVKQNKFFDHIEELNNKLYFLNKTELFGEYISSSNLEIIAKNMKKIEVEKIDERLLNEKKIYLISNGKVQMYKKNRLYKILDKGSHINSTMLLFGKKSESTYVLNEKVSLYEIDVKLFKNIPIVFWKLYLEKFS